MLVSIIAAMTEEGVIGNNGRLPWHLPADMAWFRLHTLGKPVLMGHRTLQSIGGALPERKNIILTRQSSLKINGCTVVHSLDEALVAAGAVHELMVIGGADCYSQALSMAGKMYITIVHANLKGDTMFPVYDPAAWCETSRRECPADEDNPFAMTFLTMERQEP